ncbi:MAG: putative Ig domain-containing protein [Acidimicrobiales bacterium]
MHVRRTLVAVTTALLLLVGLVPGVAAAAASPGAADPVVGSPADPADAMTAPQRQPTSRVMDPDEFQAITPTRLLDTRDGTGGHLGKVGPAETLTLQVAGRGGIPATGVGAVVLNITSTEASAVSFITAWPAGDPWPLASNVNTEPGVNTPNLAVVKLGAGGAVSLYNNSGYGHLVADALGWFPTTATFTSLTPARLLDTRDGTGGHLGTLGPRETFDLQVTGRGGVPATDVGSVVVNITSTEASEVSFITAWPAGDPWPLASNVNTDPGVNTPNLAFVKLGTDGKISLLNNSGYGHVIVDVLGWFPTQSNFRPDVPFRLMDTRDPGTGVPPGKIGPGQTLTLDLPDEPIGAVVVNITSTEASQDSFITAWPAGEPWPLASNVNTEPGVNTPNLAIVKMGAGGDVSFYNNSGTGHLVVDLLGWFPIGSTYVEVSEPGFKAQVEIPETTRDATSVLSVTPSVIPSGPEQSFDLWAEEPYVVGGLLKLDEAAAPPDGFSGQVTAVSPLAEGFQRVTAVPGALRVVVVLGPGAETFQVDDHLLLDPTDQLPDGFLGRVVSVEDLGGGVQRVTTVPGLVEDAFLEFDVDIDVNDAVEGGTVTPTLDGQALPPEMVGGTPQGLSGDLFYGFKLSDAVNGGEQIAGKIAGSLGLPGYCHLDGLDLTLGVGVRYDLGIAWRWYFKWGWLPIPRPLVTATVTPHATASIELDHAEVYCTFDLKKLGYKFYIPKTKIGVFLWYGAVMDLSVGLTGFDLHATAEANVKMGVEDNKGVFDPQWIAEQNFDQMGEVFDPNHLKAYAMVDLWFAAGVDVLGFEAFKAGVGPFAEATFSQETTEPWWKVDVGLAGTVDLFGKAIYTQEVPFIFDWAHSCATSPPYNTYFPCRATVTERPNGDVRNFAPRLRFSAGASLDPLVITTTTLPASYVDEAYPPAPQTAQLVADGHFPVATWTVVGGTFPPGLSLHPATGAISGTPTASGLYTFTVRAADAGGAYDEQVLSIRIWPQVRITTGPITAYEGYEISPGIGLQAEGWGPFTWQLIGGVLPDGVTWDAATGTIGGTPTATMVRFVTFRVTDSMGRTDTKTLAITIEKLATDRLVLGDSSAQGVDVSANGDVVVFETNTSLEPTDTNGTTDVYVYDRVANRLTRLLGGDDYRTLVADPVISDDGRYVAYTTQYWGDPFLYEAVVLHDRQTGTSTALNGGVVCASPSEPGVPAAHAAACAAMLPSLAGGSGGPRTPAISGDGTHVAYVATLSGIGPQVLVYDRTTGTTRIASMKHDGSAIPRPSCNDFEPYLSDNDVDPSLNHTGSIVAFTSSCDHNYVIRLDLTAGTMVDVLPGQWSSQPSVDASGRYVSFVKTTDDSVAGSGALYRYDSSTQTAEELVPGGARAPAISSDGSRTAFEATATWPNGTFQNVYVHLYGVGLQTATMGYAANGPNGDSLEPALSPDGSWVVFPSIATNLVPGELVTDADWDVFIHDLH